MARWSLALGGLVLAWCVIAALAGMLEARDQPADAMPELDAQFRAFAAQLPARGTVGFLEPLQNAGTPEAVQVYYAAQFALVPRVVVARVGPPFLIVPRGAARGDDDPRLAGYFRIASSRGGHRLFRRAE